jgi:hypothetical protein
MSFSYLNIVKDKVDITVINRGQKIYLEGRVKKIKDLTLDYWRSYRIFEDNIDYIINFPLLHLALVRDKWDYVYKVLDELIYCNCEYYTENGICRHICSILAALDSEFKFTKVIKDQETKKQLVSKLSIELFDQVINTNILRTGNEWINNIELYLRNPEWKGKNLWLGNMTLEIEQDINNDYKPYLDKIIEIAVNYVKNYDNEPILLELIADSIIYKASFWWAFWQKGVFSYISSKNLKYLIIKILSWFEDKQIQSIFKLIINYINLKYDFKEKLEILNQLSGFKRFKLIDLIRIGYDLDLKDWIYSKLGLLDSDNLINVAELIPEYQDEIEKIVSEQILQSILFLPSEENENFYTTMSLWEKIIGKTELFLYTLEEVIKIVRRRSKLVKQLKTLR